MNKTEFVEFIAEMIWVDNNIQTEVVGQIGENNQW